MVFKCLFVVQKTMSKKCDFIGIFYGPVKYDSVKERHDSAGSTFQKKIIDIRVFVLTSGIEMGKFQRNCKIL